MPEISKLWWLALGLIIVSLTFESGKREGAWLLIFVVLSMLFLARERRLIQ